MPFMLTCWRPGKLEVMLGQPDRIVPALVHHPRDVFRLLEDGGQVIVRLAPLVGGGGHLPHVGEIHVAGIDGGELADHGGVFLPAGGGTETPSPSGWTAPRAGLTPPPS